MASAPDDPRFLAAVSIRQIGIHSAICVPLYHEGRVEGAIYVDSRRQAAALSGEELEVLTVLGLMLAAGIAQIALRGDVARERAIRGRLARYNSPQVVEQIYAVRHTRNADEMLAEGTRLERTVRRSRRLYRAGRKLVGRRGGKDAEPDF